MAQNVNFKIEKDTLTITVNLKEDFGVSGSGKSNIIASTNGNMDIGKDGIKVGLNVYKPLGKDKSKKA